MLAAFSGSILKGKGLPKLTSWIIPSDYLAKAIFENYFIHDFKNILIALLLRPI